MTKQESWGKQWEMLERLYFQVLAKNEPELGDESDLLWEDSKNIQNVASSNVNEDQDTPNLNIITTIEVPEETEQRTVNAEVECLLSKSSVVYASVIETPGEFQNRRMDTRIRQKPSKSDIKNVNITIDLLVKQHFISCTVSPYIRFFLEVMDGELYRLFRCCSVTCDKRLDQPTNK